MTTKRLFEALVFAAKKHQDQRRKGSEHAPYINHPIQVAAVLSVEAGIDDEATLVAAILHDTVEDTPTTFKEIDALFGEEVAGLVKEMTDDKLLPSPLRKQLQIKHAPSLSDKAKLLKFADKTANVRDLASNPPENWSLARQIAYLDWTEAVIAGCRGVNSDLERIYDQALRKAREILVKE